jgi:hypothetical protein
MQLPDTVPPSNGSKEMITTLRVARVPIVLEKTELKDVQRRLGGRIRARGDASEAIAWLCFCGTDTNGRWALWLESGELAGLDLIDGFTWQRLDANARTEGRCRMIPDGDDGIELPIALRLGLTEMQVRKILGSPTLRYRGTLYFSHEYKHTIRNEPYTVYNDVTVALRDGLVWAIRVSKDSEN